MAGGRNSRTHPHLPARMLGLFFLSLAFSSCGPLAHHVDVMRGNYEYGRGNYQQATVHYLRIPETDSLDPYLAYNLGNVYHALGEVSASVQAWSRSGATDDEELLYATSFNRGVLFYELGRFREAYDQFRYALTIDPTSIDAKANLELSLQKIEAGESVSTTAGSAPAQPVEPGLNREQQRTLEYVRRKEQQLWRANEQVQDDDRSRDW